MPERKVPPIPNEDDIGAMVAVLADHFVPEDSDSLMKPEVLASVYPVLFSFADKGFTPEAMMSAIKLAGSELRRAGGSSTQRTGA